MRVPASFFREQEALQRAKVASEPLENRRKIALTAANAWETAAILAEKQTSKEEALDKLDADITLEFAREDLALAAEEAENAQVVEENQ